MAEGRFTGQTGSRMPVIQQPAVSVVLPNFNHAKFLPARLESILKQTFTDFELILLDDASSDNSRQILSEVQDPRITHRIFNTENSGSPFIQWERGVRLARAPLIWIAESDDLCSHHFLETLVPGFSSSPDLALVYCQSAIIDETGNQIGSQLEWTSDLGSDRWETGFTNEGSAEISQYLLRKSTIPNASGVVFRRERFPTGLPFSRFRQTGDTLTWCLIISGARLKFIPDSLNYHRYHPSTVRAGTSRSRRFIDIIYFSRELERRIGFSDSDRQALCHRFDSLTHQIEKEPVFFLTSFQMLLQLFPVMFRQPYQYAVRLVVQKQFRFLTFRFRTRLDSLTKRS